MKKPYAVAFAGVPGSSKTPIAFYLSIKFGLPIFNNDELRNEVRENLLTDDIRSPRASAEFERLTKERHEQALSTGRPVIFDGSVDRRWPETKKQLQDHGYSWFLINLELSLPFLTKLFSSTGRGAFVETKLANYLKQHNDFRAAHQGDISLEITDKDFINRMEVTATGLEQFLSARG